MYIIKVLKTTLALISTLAILTLSGCASSGANGGGVLPAGGLSMEQIYNSQMLTDDSGLSSVRNQLPSSNQRAFSYRHQKIRPASTGSGPRFLPNPTIKVYVYPHFSGDDQDYIPGHSAYSKMYKESHFALPDEPGLRNG